MVPLVGAVAVLGADQPDVTVGGLGRGDLDLGHVGGPVDRCELPLRPDGPETTVVLVLRPVVDAEDGGAVASETSRQESEPAGHLVVVVWLQPFSGERLADRVDDDDVGGEGFEACHRVTGDAALPVDERPIGADVDEPVPHRLVVDAEGAEATHGGCRGVLVVDEHGGAAGDEGVGDEVQRNPRLAAAGFTGERVDAPGVEEADAIVAGQQRGCGRVVGAVEDGREIDELPVALVVGGCLDDVGQLRQGALGERRDAGPEGVGVERVLGMRPPSLRGQCGRCGGVVTVEPCGSQVAELRVGLLLVEAGGTHRRGEHLEDVRTLVPGGGRRAVTQLLAGPGPVVLSVAVDVVQLPPVAGQQVRPGGCGGPLVAGAVT